jgi:hypothetical protein
MAKKSAVAQSKADARRARKGIQAPIAPIRFAEVSPEAQRQQFMARNPNIFQVAA